MRSLSLIAFIMFGSHSAYAGVVLDRQVQNFLDKTTETVAARQSPLNVLVVMKSPVESGSTTVKELKSRLDKGLRSLSGEMAWVQSRRFEKIWIVNGFMGPMRAEELRQLTLSPQIQGIYWSAKPYKMHRSRRSTRVERAGDYTYGLKKINIPEVQKRYPHLRGTGVRVGVLDTGIAADHPDLRGRLKVYRNFSPAKETEPRDDYGHGTHVSGTIVGGDESGQRIGVAPDADLIVGRIFDGNGDSSRAEILRAMQWMADPDGNSATNDFAQVVNSSWSDDDPYDQRSPENEPFCQIINNWVRLGMIPVFSAGNTGPSEGTINIPAGCPEAFSVGATEQNDRSPHFSSTGPARWKGLDLMKPEVSAPGFDIYSADRYGGYEEMSGTSMAAPHVSGAFAILIQAFPNVPALEIQRSMANGAKDLGDPGQDAVFGYGRIDILKSLELLGQKARK